MLHATPGLMRATTSRVESRLIPMPTVCIVDPRLEGFGLWRSASDEVRIHMATTGRDALRLANRVASDLWIVNCSLPDLSGTDLCQMLKSRDARSVVYLLADEYSAEQEQAARLAHANLFGVKPAHQQWLSDWLAHWRAHAPARRAG